MKPSEFGKGLVICLVKFAEHFDNHFAEPISIANTYLSKTEKEKELMLSSNPPANLDYGFPYMTFLRHFVDSIKFWGSEEKAFSDLITLWANGSSDHLYNIEVPKKLRNTKLGRKILLLQKLGLDMGHGKGLTGKKIYTFKDFKKLRELTREIALLLDKKLGLKADLGEF